jgi:spore germination protein KC
MRVAAVALGLSMLLTGCWDSREIDALFILTGIAVDAADNPDQVAVTLQIADIKQGESGSGGGGNTGGSDATILLSAVSDTISGCINEINRDSDHKLLFQHNQIRLFGIDLAEKGIEEHLDLFLRDQQARLEVPLVVVDGRAEEALSASLAQEPVSGIFLGGMFEDLSEVSSEYRVRLIDFIHMLLDEGTAPVLPIIKVTGKGNKQEIKLTGMAVFKGERMIGRLSNDETLGYIWSFGDVKECNFEVTDASSKAVLHIAHLDCEREVTLRQDGGVSVALTVNAVVGIGELSGFRGMKPPELLKHLEKMAEEEIKKKITTCFSAAQSLNADIFGYCTTVYQKYPQQWNSMKDQWDTIFPNIDLSVQAKVRIPGTGQIVQSLEMEEGMK